MCVCLPYRGEVVTCVMEGEVVEGKIRGVRRQELTKEECMRKRRGVCGKRSKKRGGVEVVGREE